MDIRREVSPRRQTGRSLPVYISINPLASSFLFAFISVLLRYHIAYCALLFE